MPNINGTITGPAPCPNNSKHYCNFYSTTSPTRRGFSRNYGQRTSGSDGAKRTLDTLMNTKNEENGIRLSSFDDMDKSGGSPTRTKNMGRDSDSEEAILFERSVQVTYETRHVNNMSGGGAARGYEETQYHQPKVWTGRKAPHAH